MTVPRVPELTKLKTVETVLVTWREEMGSGERRGCIVPMVQLYLIK